MIDIRPLLEPGFWFSSSPTPIYTENSRLLLALFAIMIIVGAIVRIVARRRASDRYVKQIFARVSSMLTTIGFLGLIWLFFTVEQVTFFQGRYWALFLGLGALTWIGFIVRYAKKIVPVERERHNEYKERMKYLPKSKKR